MRVYNYGPERTPLITRFWSHVEITEGCWFWTGAKNGEGYGKISEGGHRSKQLTAHRLAYEYLIGPIPEGKHIDHLCCTPSCVNPAHLEPVSLVENLQRAKITSPRSKWRTHCKHGHLYDVNNTIFLRAPGDRFFQRVCRACRKIRNQKKRAA